MNCSGSTTTTPVVACKWALNVIADWQTDAQNTSHLLIGGWSFLRNVDYLNRRYCCA